MKIDSHVFANETVFTANTSGLMCSISTFVSEQSFQGKIYSVFYSSLYNTYKIFDLELALEFVCKF